MYFILQCLLTAIQLHPFVPLLLLEMLKVCNPFFLSFIPSFLHSSFLPCLPPPLHLPSLTHPAVFLWHQRRSASLADFISMDSSSSWMSSIWNRRIMVQMSPSIRRGFPSTMSSAPMFSRLTCTVEQIMPTIGDIFINVDVARDSFPLTSNMLFPVTVGGRDGVECASMQHLGY